MIYFKKDLERARKEGVDRVNNRDNLQLKLMEDQIRDLDEKNRKLTDRNTELLELSEQLQKLGQNVIDGAQETIRNSKKWRDLLFVSICFNVIFVGFLIKFTAQ